MIVKNELEVNLRIEGDLARYSGCHLRINKS